MNNIVNILKLPPTIMSGLAIASGLLLFLPDHIIDKLYMTDLKEEYGLLIGGVFIISVSILVSYIGVSVSKAIYSKIINEKRVKLRKKQLKKLNNEEKELLKYFMDQPDKTLKLPMNNGITIKLQYYKIITPAGNNHLVLATDMRIPYFLQPWVQEFLSVNPHLLESST
ncbi:superinfection exclusion B family protein [Lentibacillus cibarius]|uniref:Conjugal transfer protein n=1 Tax=Lentibacillus cibarius TaxID=2583219 RepID=A0A5S3QKZ0_9BACI|nr:superinfection exclusion B family protein [Lentibacillus cibarius]TMN21881.1 conjugal transfer protein [Lentibacillus cibarius]